jgi:photosystem II stability/assembly factor-like uncharacterized protein
MRVPILVYVLFILIPLRVVSQVGWFNQPSGTGNNLNGVYFANNNTGIVAGQSGTVLRTTNSGTNWNPVSTGTGVHLFGVFFIDANTGWVVGDVGYIMKTVNGGLNWTAQTSGVGYQLRSVSFRNTQTGYIAGWYGTFLRTTNGGTTWVQFATGITTNLNCVSFADANVGFAAGQFGKVIRTTNGGVNWVEISSGTTAQIEQVVFTGTNQATIIGENGIIRKTTNLGANWVTQSSGTGNWLNGMNVKQQNFFIIVGDYGTIRKTSNGGTNWYQQVSNTGNLLKAVSFVDTNTGWAVGINGTIIKTTTGGWVLPGTPSLTAPGNNATCFSMTGTLDWNDIFPPITNYRVQVSTSNTFGTTVIDQSGLGTSQFVLSSQLAYNTQYYWRVRATNQVGDGPWSSVRNFRTTTPMPQVPGLISPANNAGTNQTPQLRWDSITTASTYRCRIATDTGFTNLVLDSAGITNRYINVPSERLQINTRYYWKVNAGNSCNTSAYSVRWSFITSLTGITLNNSEIPSVYELYANYPNPFNPVTLINFDLPENSRVRITIYNAIGELVNIPADKDLSAGKYSLDWDGSDYASGLYFYRIEALSNLTGGKSFIKTRKMLMIK